MVTEHECSLLSTTTTSGHAVHGDGSLTSSPVTSVSDGHAGDAWRESPLRRGTRDEMSPMSDSSAAIPSNTRSTEGNKAVISHSLHSDEDGNQQADKPKSVEIKVQRTERLERREKFDNKDWLNNNDTYAMPR
ncbi:hypothetical protein NECAME_05602 [Necator americanus]|uniref:Uncharacterized protein n=1 Tax=Necator americanus TaxID=51031 RepID=W2SFM5_NECAM|nr:hypothetical protein NECAME_05602 [Necator americanus]ETN68414.1 hypothetical protein NECAME_05602 [Necator americanus]